MERDGRILGAKSALDFEFRCERLGIEYFRRRGLNFDRGFGPDRRPYRCLGRFFGGFRGHHGSRCRYRLLRRGSAAGFLLVGISIGGIAERYVLLLPFLGAVRQGLLGLGLVDVDFCVGDLARRDVIEGRIRAFPALHRGFNIGLLYRLRIIDDGGVIGDRRAFQRALAGDTAALAVRDHNRGIGAVRGFRRLLGAVQQRLFLNAINRLRDGIAEIGQIVVFVSAGNGPRVIDHARASDC